MGQEAPLRVATALLLACAVGFGPGCAPRGADGADSADSGAPGDSGDSGDTGGIIGVCEAPADLPADPLAVVGASDPQADPQGGQRTHLIDVERRDGRVYASGTGGLYLFDETAAGPDLVGSWRDGGELAEVEPLGGDVVLATNRERGFFLLDTADPTTITPLARVQLPDVAGGAVAGDRLYLLTHTGALYTIDVGDPAQPRQVAHLDGLGNPWDLVVAGDVAYVADNTLGVVVLDLSDPDAPAIGAVVPAAGPVQNVALGGGLLASAVGAAGVELFDLADPAHPATLGATSLGGSVVDVALAGDRLWTADLDGVRVLDVSDPAAPVALAFEPTDQWAMEVVADGARAWVAAWGQLVELDLAASLAPQADPGRSALYVDGAGTYTLPIANRGGADLHLAGIALPDARFVVSVDRTVVPPGGEATVTLVYTPDGAPVDAALCIASDDPAAPLQEIPVATGSAGTESIAVGEVAVDFTLDDLDGQPHRLSDQLGHPVLLVYFATW